MRVYFSPSAKAEVAEIGAFIAAKNPEAAKRILRDIKLSALDLKLFPLRGREQDKFGVRRILSSTYRYMIYYRYLEAQQEVEVITVLHGRQSRRYQDT